MYIEKGRNLSAKTIARALLARLEETKYYQIRECSRIRREMTQDPELIHRVSGSIKALNDALLKGRSVYATCDRQPRGNLDTGHHYYSIHMVSAKGQLERLNLDVFSLLLGGTENKRHRDLCYWIFSSGAIGTSRLLDATDEVFVFLQHAGGCYTQLGCL